MEKIKRVTKADTPLQSISQEHLDAIYFFAKASGPNWKEKLKDAWFSGNYKLSENSYLLQQVRNRVAPSLVDSLLNQFVVHHKKEQPTFSEWSPFDGINQSQCIETGAQLGVYSTDSYASAGEAVNLGGMYTKMYCTAPKTFNRLFMV